MMLLRRWLIHLMVRMPLRLTEYSTRTKQRRAVSAVLIFAILVLFMTLSISSFTSPKQYLILDDTFDNPVLVEKIYIKRWSIAESQYLVENLDKLNDMMFEKENMYEVAEVNQPQIAPEDGGFDQDNFQWQLPEIQADDTPRRKFLPRYSFNKQEGDESPAQTLDDWANALVSKRDTLKDNRDQVLLPPRNDVAIKQNELQDLQSQENNLIENNEILGMPNKLNNEIPRMPEKFNNEILRKPEKFSNEILRMPEKLSKGKGPLLRVPPVENKFRYIQYAQDLVKNKQTGENQKKPSGFNMEYNDYSDNPHGLTKVTTPRPAFVRHQFIQSKTVRDFPIEKPRRQDSQIPKEFFNIKTVVNPHNYAYILNPRGVCDKVDGANVFVIVPIISSVDHFNVRQTIRNTWGQFSAVYGRQVRFVFMLGASKLPYLQDFVKQESDIYGDIVQESFIDTYFNSNLKAIFTLRWVQTFCSNAKFMLRLNDDVMLHIYKFIRYLETAGLPETKLYWGQVYHHSRVDVGLAKHEYRSKIPWRAGAHYPPYCNGPYILMTMDVVKNMYKMSERTPLMFPEDVYYGILAEKLGTRTYDASLHLLDQDQVHTPVRDNARPEMMAHLGSDDRTRLKMQYMWKVVQKRTKDKTGCVKRELILDRSKLFDNDIDNRIPT